MSNLAATVGDARKRIEDKHAREPVAAKYPPCTCTHGRMLHYVNRPGSAELACVCGCPGYAKGGS